MRGPGSLTRWTITTRSLPVAWATALFCLTVQVAAIIGHPPVPWETLGLAYALSVVSVGLSAGAGYYLGRRLGWATVASSDAPPHEGAHPIWDLFGHSRHLLHLRKRLNGAELKAATAAFREQETALWWPSMALGLAAVLLPVCWSLVLQPFFGAPARKPTLLGLAAALPPLGFVAAVTLGCLCVWRRADWADF